MYTGCFIMNVKKNHSLLKKSFYGKKCSINIGLILKSIINNNKSKFYCEFIIVVIKLWYAVITA